jgi:hypothetical protein
MATFRPPYGPRDPKDHVTSPAQHFGYRYLVAYLTYGESTSQTIKQACSDAYDEGAPKDAVCRLYSFGNEWKRRDDIAVNFGRTLDSYAAALTKYEEELKAERRAGA